MPWTIYVVKVNMKTWWDKPGTEDGGDITKHNLNFVRVWLILEIVFYFNWILMSIFFIGYAYIFKIQSSSKDPVILSVDDNVWNDRDTCDFLKYLKFEYFFITYMFTMLLT